MSATEDFVQRFLLEDLDIRGALVRLGPVWRQMLAGRAYGALPAMLLGQATAVTALVAANLKQTGRLTLQVRGHGPLSMLVVDCTDGLAVRGLVKGPADLQPAPFSALLGDGQLALTLELQHARQPYQSVVPLQGDSLAECMEHYLSQSEQCATRLWLFADGETASGLFLQCLPDAAHKDADGWNRIQILAGTVKAAELARQPVDRLLPHLFPDETLRLFPAREVSYGCARNEAKVEDMLRSLGRSAVDDILREQGRVEITDDICNQVYCFGAAEVARIFGDDTAATLH